MGRPSYDIFQVERKNQKSCRFGEKVEFSANSCILGDKTRHISGFPWSTEIFYTILKMWKQAW